jgi:hypothetical protein
VHIPETVPNAAWLHPANPAACKRCCDAELLYQNRGGGCGRCFVRHPEPVEIRCQATAKCVPTVPLQRCSAKGRHDNIPHESIQVNRLAFWVREHQATYRISRESAVQVQFLRRSYNLRKN